MRDPIDAPTPGGRALDQRRAQGTASRQRLLEAATELFAERGIAATGVDAVCRRADVVKSALYWHFGSKEGLLAAVVDRVGRSWVDEILASVVQTGDRLERLERFVGGLRDLVEKRPELLRLLLAVTLERAEGNAESREAVRLVFARSEEAILAGLRDTLGDDLPEAEAAARLSLNLLVGLALRRLLAPDEDAAPHFQELRDLMERELTHRLRVRARAQPPAKER
jgi:AcrR family transcriptional regulator